LFSNLLNDWKIAGVFTIGSGRPADAKVFGDLNQDGNSFNNRLPGYGRNASDLTMPPPTCDSRAISLCDFNCSST